MRTDDQTPPATTADASPALAPAPLLGTIGIASVQLSKNEGWRSVHSMTMHWRRNISDHDQMRGMAVTEALKAKPGFSIDTVLVEIVEVPLPNESPAYIEGNMTCFACQTAPALDGVTGWDADLERELENLAESWLHRHATAGEMTDNLLYCRDELRRVVARAKKRQPHPNNPGQPRVKPVAL